jgi:serine/threonine-protein kinase
MTFGTPTYMSPEQAQAKQLDSRSDLYSLGVMLFEMLAGKPPFEGETPLALMLQKVQEQPPTVFHVNPEVRIPAPLDDLITRMLATKPADRPADATAVKTLLAAATAADAGLVQMGPVVVREGTTQKFAASRVPDLAGDAGLETARPEVFPPDKARLPWAWIAGGIAAGVVGIAAALLVMSGGGATTEPASATPAPAAVPAPAAAPATATTPVPAPAPAAPAPTPAAPAPVAVPAVAPAPAAPSPAPAVQPQPRKAGTAAKAPAKAPPPAEPEDDIGRLLKKGSGKTEDEFLLKKAGGR